MAGSSLLTLLDDIATVLDDVAILSKVAAKKTAGVLGDDLALNAEQVSGIKAERELPVVWAVAKGSFKNKLILVPAALLISAFVPWLITPLLMLGGGYLCYEGFEKVLHHFLHSQEQSVDNHKKLMQVLSDPKIDMVEYEKGKIKGAIRTDFILSAEIIVIALGTVKEAEFSVQVGVVSLIAIVITLGVYGLVAAIVKLDDAGYYLIKDKSVSFFAGIKRGIGKCFLIFAPFLMKALTVIGTIAMFLVGGSILLHGFHFIAEKFHSINLWIAELPNVGGFLSVISPMFFDLIFGLTSGGIILLVITLWFRFFPKSIEVN